MILSNQPTRFLRYNLRMNQLLNLCGRGEIRNKVSDLIKKGKCAKCNDYVSLENDNHISVYVVHPCRLCKTYIGIHLCTICHKPKLK